VGKKFLLGTGILIGIYLIAANATGFGRALQATGNVYAQGVKTLQGRG
jgi:hypothetical protein